MFQIIKLLKSDFAKLGNNICHQGFCNDWEGIFYITVEEILAYFFLGRIVYISVVWSVSDGVEH